MYACETMSLCILFKNCQNFGAQFIFVSVWFCCLHLFPYPCLINNIACKDTFAHCATHDNFFRAMNRKFQKRNGKYTLTHKQHRIQREREKTRTKEIIIITAYDIRCKSLKWPDYWLSNSLFVVVIVVNHCQYINSQRKPYFAHFQSTAIIYFMAHRNFCNKRQSRTFDDLMELARVKELNEIQLRFSLCDNNRDLIFHIFSKRKIPIKMHCEVFPFALFEADRRQLLWNICFLPSFSSFLQDSNCPDIIYDRRHKSVFFVHIWNFVKLNWNNCDDSN